jgi:aspartyl-tRNA synthetase
MALEEELIIEGLKNVKEKYGDDIKRVYDIDVVIPKVPFPIIDLKDLYKELESRYNYHVDDSEKGDLTTEGERLCERLSKDKYNSEFLFVTGYSSNNRAFYHMRDKNGVPCGYDLIWKGVEITTGAQREHRYDILKQQAEEKGLTKDVEFYLDFFKYGCPPHGGFAIGLDRITMLLLNLPSLKETMFVFRGPNRLNP